MNICFSRVLSVGSLLASVVIAYAARQGMMDPMGMARKMQSSATMLTGLPDVKKDLKLTGEQGKKIDAIRNAYQKEMATMARGMQGGGGDMTAAMGMMRGMEAAQEKADADIRAELQPEQATRLRALQYQALGAKALYEKDLQKTLNMTPEQIAKIDALKAGEMSRMSNLFTSGTKDMKEMQRKLKEAKEEGIKSLLAILTPEQAAKHREVLGTPVKSVMKMGDAGF